MQETRSKEMVKQLQDQAKGVKNINPSVFLEQIEHLESQNRKLQAELDTLYLKHEREKQEIISQAKKTEYQLMEDNSRKDIEIQKLQLQNQKNILEKDNDLEKFKCRMEKELKELQDVYLKEKTHMENQLEQASIHTKALQMLSGNETFLSPVSLLISLYLNRERIHLTLSIPKTIWRNCCLTLATIFGALSLDMRTQTQAKLRQ